MRLKPNCYKLTLASFPAPQLPTPTPFSKFSKLKRTAMTVASQMESEEEEIATSTNLNFIVSVSPTLSTHTHPRFSLKHGMTKFQPSLNSFYILLLSWYLDTYLPVFELSRHHRWIIILCELAGNSHCCVYKPVAAAYFLDLS